MWWSQSQNTSHLLCSCFLWAPLAIYQAFPCPHWIKFSALPSSCAHHHLPSPQTQCHSITSRNFIIFSLFVVALPACIMVFTTSSFKISIHLMHFCAFRKILYFRIFLHVCPSLWTHNLWDICPNGSLHFLMPRMLNPFYHAKGHHLFFLIPLQISLLLAPFHLLFSLCTT